MLSNLENVVKTTLDLQKAGHKVVIVSSGAIGVGLKRMNYKMRPKHSSKLQVRYAQMRFLYFVITLLRV